jgi:hypothetical protein
MGRETWGNGMRIPRAIRQANELKAQKPAVELNIDPTEAWIRWASGLHLSPKFDRYAYNVAFLTHLVNLIGEEPEYVEEESPAIEADALAVDARPMHKGTGNTKGVHAHHMKAWLQIVNLSRQAGADLLGWHRSSIVKVLSGERNVTESQSVRFLEVLAKLDEWQRLQYVAMVKGTQ